MKRIQDTSTNRRGAMLPLIAVCLPLIILFAAYSINIAQMQLTRTELRTATDAASRAGARTLSITQNQNQAQQRAIEAARRNVVSGSSLALAPSDLNFGLSQPSASGGRWEFVESTNPFDPSNSVRVTGRRTEGSLSGPIPLLFPAFSKSGVFEPVKTATATQIDRDISLVLDRSGSMTAPVNPGRRVGRWRRGGPAPNGSKWLDLVSATNAFLTALESTPQDEKVALITYGTRASHELDLTLKYNDIRNQMRAHTRNYRGGRTAVGDGADLGVRAVTNPRFARRYAQKTIVVMTDGNHNEGKWPDRVAEAAHNDSNVTVHTITFGPDVNANLMRRTAELGGGQYWHATDAASLVNAFEEIANNLPTLITE
jgi:uncharacterized protein YegL